MSSEGLRQGRKLGAVALCAVLVFFVWFVRPFVSAGLPYFSGEDEAHHFNRTVEMVKEGRFDPQYFHKPSLHFYLRMPVVAAAFLASVRNGHIRKIQEIRTRDSYGLAGYNFTASHPGIVKANRWFSVFLGLGVLLLVYAITQQLTHSQLAGISAALFLGFSPDFIEESAKISVDIVMCFFCLLTLWAAIESLYRVSMVRILFVGLLAGLSISSKYNALPIALVPLMLAWGAKERRGMFLLAALFSLPVGFLIGTPFALSSLPLFLNQLAYEIWHYGVAGHAGHMAEPGLDQLRFFITWMGWQSLGWLALGGTLLGAIFAARQVPRKAIFLLVFAACFFALMVSQKANFTRNLLVLLPLGAIGATFFGSLLLTPFQKSRVVSVLVWGIFCFSLSLQPATRAFALRGEALRAHDSRDEAAQWLEQNPIDGETALAGNLQLPWSLRTAPSYSVVNTSQLRPQELYLRGFDRVVLGSGTTEWWARLKREQMVAGVPGTQRIVTNPLVQIFSLRNAFSERALQQFVEHTPKFQIPLKRADAELAAGAVYVCSPEVLSSGEEYCWITSRVSELILEKGAQTERWRNGPVRLILRVMSPWASQLGHITVGGVTREFRLAKAGEFEELHFDFPACTEDHIWVELSDVHAPASFGASADTRRLGLALSKARLFSLR